MIDLTMEHVKKIEDLQAVYERLAVDDRFTDLLKKEFKKDAELFFDILQVVEGHVKLQELHRQLHHNRTLRSDLQEDR